MDREEAIVFLKRIASTHNSLLDYVSVVPPDETNNTLSVGYQLHIKGGTFHSITDLENRVKKYGLLVKEERDKIIIYKPRI